MQNDILQDESSLYDYRLSVHFCIDRIANAWVERLINGNSRHGNLYSVWSWHNHHIMQMNIRQAIT